MRNLAAMASGAAALMLAATGAHAQSTQAQSTQSQSTQSQSTQAQPPAPDPTSAQIASWIAGNHGEVDDDAPQAATRLRDGKVHGEVGASIGSGGYRSAYGIATKPIGPNSDLTVGVSSEHLGDANRTGWGGRYRGGDRKSLFIGLNLNGADRSDGCDVLAPRPWGGALEPLSRAAPERCGPAATTAPAAAPAR